MGKHVDSKLLHCDRVVLVVPLFDYQNLKVLTLQLINSKK